jgi:hypothetical protein
MAKALVATRAEDVLGHLTASPYEALAQLYTTAIWTEPALASYRRFIDLGRPRLLLPLHPGLARQPRQRDAGLPRR